MDQDFRNQLGSIVGSDNVYEQEPMKKHTTFRVGGPADYFVTPHSKKEIISVMKACKEAQIPFYIIGNGSNLLVSDQGYSGVIIQIYKNYSDIQVEDDVITVKAGASLAKVAKRALESGLAGFEFAAGIPGTIGGAVVMNAGAYGGEMKDVIIDAQVLMPDGEVVLLGKEELELGYRTSSIIEKNATVLKARLQLHTGSREVIQQRMDELKEQRITKQPLEYPSAGSTFKRPEGHFAGKLIMDAGLRGYKVGDAQVSEKHCGFVVNKGNATAQDVKTLMEDVKTKVYEEFGVTLEAEVKMLGEFK